MTETKLLQIILVPAVVLIVLAAVVTFLVVERNRLVAENLDQGRAEAERLESAEFSALNKADDRIQGQASNDVLRPGRKSMGVWIEVRGPIQLRTEFFVEDGVYTRVRRAMSDGSGGAEVMTAFRDHQGTLWFVDRPDNRFGDRYTITSDGYLEAWDNEGLIFRCAPVR